MAVIVDFLIVLLLSLLFYVNKIPFIIAAIRNPNINVDVKVIFDSFRSGAVLIIVLIFYFVAIPFYLKGQTIGKRIFKLKIVNEDGSDVGVKELFFREIIGKLFIDFLSLGLSIISSFIIMCLRDDKKSLADIIAKTKVIDIYREEKEDVNRS
jgi:uncharacterized RDD family membrane protein YckC